MKNVNMLDLCTEFGLFEDEIRSAVHAVLESQQFINGPAVGELEETLKSQIGAGHAVAVSNGTDALLCTMMALELRPGDEVILPAFTFFGTAGSVARTGAKPIFVDVDPRTFNIDPAAVEAALTDRTKAICAVHIFGQCADMDAINAIAARRGIPVIEDAAQSLGANYKGRQACTLGDVACVSFYPTKNLGGLGEGGMIFTDDAELAAIARQLRNHGESARYVHERVGGNFRLDTLKAAMLLVKLRYWDEFTRRRQQNAARYNEGLAGAAVTTPYVPEGHEPVYHQYTILCERRDELQAFLRDRGVYTGIYYAIPLHLQKCFAALGYREGDLPVTEKICGQVLSLPCHPMLAREELDYVVACIHEFEAGVETAGGTAGRSLKA